MIVWKYILYMTVLSTPAIFGDWSASIHGHFFWWNKAPDVICSRKLAGSKAAKSVWKEGIENIPPRSGYSTLISIIRSLF
jgi:hypothetical protein